DIALRERRSGFGADEISARSAAAAARRYRIRTIVRSRRTFLRALEADRQAAIVEPQPLIRTEKRQANPTNENILWIRQRVGRQGDDRSDAAIQRAERPGHRCELVERRLRRS